MHLVKATLPSHDPYPFVYRVLLRSTHVIYSRLLTTLSLKITPNTTMDWYLYSKYHINRKYIWISFIAMLLKETVNWTEFLDLKYLFHFSHKSSQYSMSQEIDNLYQIYDYKTWVAILEIQYQDHRGMNSVPMQSSFGMFVLFFAEMSHDSSSSFY